MHRYLAYSPDLFITDVGHDLSRPCVWWQPGNNASLNNFGYTFTGEWCLAINDCGQWINGLGTGSHYGGNFNSTATTPVGDCANYVNYKTFPDAFKTQLKQLTAMYMDHTRGSFFWSWRMGANSTGESKCPFPTRCMNSGSAQSRTPCGRTSSAWTKAGSRPTRVWPPARASPSRPS
jgi:glucan 1,3-beta-glucosidase